MLCASLPESLPKANSLTFITRADAKPELVQRLLSNTFRDSLDCPELNSIRTPDEVEEGYLAGTPNPSQWWLALEGETSVGLLILGEGMVPALRDLAYLGVIPAMRRRGIARSMLSFAMHQARVDGATGMTLLVDERNSPAIALYQQSGFRQFEVRGVYLRRTSLE
jgi:ribosomal protein S18 acetylase RimI-like enzyme